MKRALVIGGCNQVSAYLVPGLLAELQAVTVLSRRPRPPWVQAHPALDWRLNDLKSLPAAETAYFLAPLPLFELFASHVRSAGHVVVFSSTSAETKADSDDDHERSVARDLLDGEAAVERTLLGHATCTILRPTLIYGAGLDANLTRIAATIRRWRCFPLVGQATGRRQPIHAEDLAATARRAAAAVGGCHAVAGGSTLTYRDMVERVFQSLDLRPRFIQVPTAFVSPAVALARRFGRWRDLNPAMLERMNRDLVFDDSQARAVLGHDPRAFAPTRETWQRLDQRDWGR